MPRRPRLSLIKSVSQSDEAVAVCEAAADAYIKEIEDIGLTGYQKTYGADTIGVRNARQNQDTK